MFQYAAARALSLHLGYSLKLDVSGFTKYKLHHGFELSRIFNGPFVLASDLEIQSILGWRRSAFAQRVLLNKGLSGLRGSRLFIEPHFNYWPGLKNITDDSYMAGYWQSEYYFASDESFIRNEFTFRLPISDFNAEVSYKINSTNAVSLHVRRGDYVNNAQTRSVHGLASIDYYNRAIRYIYDRVNPVHLFIFSDDIEWVKGNLKTNLPSTYLDHNNGQESYVDMRLMSSCRHHIIANSSFSWWGAWLNPSPSKIVIAPRKWFASGVDTEDLIPSGWITL